MTTEPDTFRVSVLGPFRVWRGDAELRLGPARQRALLAVLVFRHGHTVSREELVNAVWGQDAPATAVGSVHTYVSGLRKILQPDRSARSTGGVLASDGTGYRLGIAGTALDAAEFNALSVTSAEALAHGDSGRAAALADRALGLWNGEPLTGLPGPFAASCRQHLVDTRLSLLETRATAALQAGRHGDLVAELTGLVAQHPLHEGLRGLLMVALYRCDRQADALETFRQARQAFAAELGAPPGPRLAEIHQQILVNDPRMAAPAARPPTPARYAARPKPRAASVVGRADELTRLRRVVAELVDEGRGRVVLVEGPPGIGKSELLTVGLAELDAGSVRLCWGAGDELARRFPLRAILDCLGPAAGAAAGADPLGGGDPSAAADELVDTVRAWCADGPVAVVLDDLHWADAASLLVADRLAPASLTLPLLLVAACRPVADNTGVDHFRESVDRCGGIVLTLGSLSGGAVEELLLGIGVPPGSGLRAVASRAAGNPLYVWELADVLLRSGDASTGVERLSLAAALTRRLGFLSRATIEVLRQAAPLGQDFRVDELAVVVDRPPEELVALLGEAATAGVVVAEGDRLSFRQPLIRQALYEGTPPSVRAALHRQAAERLARSGASIEVVARQLAAMPLTVDPWTTNWVCAQGEEVAGRAPEIGVDLLRRVRAACDPADPRVVGLTAALARVLHRLGDAAEPEARAVLAVTRDPELAGEMHWILGSVFSRRGLERDAGAALRAAVADGRISATWRARCRALLAAREFHGLDDRQAAETTALTAIDEAAAVGDAFATGYALLNLWLLRTAERNHREALWFADEALRALEATPGAAAGAQLAQLYLRALDYRIRSLQSLDRLAEAEDALAVAAAAARHHRLAGLPDSAAAAHFWAGRWDSALAETSTVDSSWRVDAAVVGPREPGATMLALHGVAALIAVLRDDTAAATAHLAAADELSLLTAAERALSDFLIVAEALAAERAGSPEAALRALAPLLDERYAPLMPRCLWLPDVVRIARSAGDADLVARAVELAETEARREKPPARAAAAAARCRGLAAEDPDALLAAVAHYESVGRRVELAWSAEDAAESLVWAGRHDEALALLARAIAGYEEFGAVWAVRRARARFAAAGGLLADSA